MKRCGLGFLFLCLCHLASVAQQDQFRFSRLNINHGLSHNYVSSFLKDSRGFVWVGTSSGLNRFDGYSVRVFRNDLRDTATISNNFINSMFEDPDGRIWVYSTTGTTDINIFDPNTERFSHRSQPFLKNYGIPEGGITDIFKDSDGRFWFAHQTHGLFRYSPRFGTSMPARYLPEGETITPATSISHVTEDAHGSIWVILKNGALEKMNSESLEVEHVNTYLRDLYRKSESDFKLVADNDGDLWIFSSNSNYGVIFYDVDKGQFKHINEDSRDIRLNNNIVRGIAQDNLGYIWIATDHGGLNIIDKEKQTIRYQLNNPSDEKSLAQNSINCMYKDRDGIIWLGSFKQGVSYYHESIVRFPLFRHEPTDPSSPGYSDINCFVEDKQKNLWMGSNGGGLLYWDRSRGMYKTYRHSINDPSSLSSDVIVSMTRDTKDNLWIGTYYGGLNKFDGRKFTHYRHDPSDPQTLGDESVWEVLEDSRGNLWAGTLQGGLDMFDREANIFRHYRNGDMNSIRTNYVTVLEEDSKGNLWVGTGFGIDVLERETGRFVHYSNEPGNDRSLSNNSILWILEDSRKLIWVGTLEGLNMFDPAKKTFTAFRTEDGLPHNTILTILEDKRGNLWMSTPNGLSNLDISTDAGNMKFSFRNYDESDGLQGKQFNDNAALQTSDGHLIFGGVNGFNMFRPEDIRQNTVKPQVILSDFQITNKSIRPGELIDGKLILPRAINTTDHIELDHNHNAFSIGFAALSYIHPEKSQYRYILEGSDKEWLTTSGMSRKATYTNLDPGDYRFRVTASNNDGVWSDQAVTLHITILPPFWKTSTAFVMYFFTVLGILLMTRRLIQQRERMKFAIEQERRESQRMHELDLMKIKFFTNVSHEFRTPLTLILTPLEKMLKSSSDDQKGQLELIHRNARRLLNLINQLLDFRKLEVQEIKFNPSEGDVIRFIKETAHSFTDLSEKKNIGFSFIASVDSLEMIFDQDKLEKILFNLLSNAFKFTPENGTVSVEVDVKKEGDARWLDIRVMDTGIGIPAENIEKIFDRFFQNDVPRSMVNQGTGIGLSIVKEFVRSFEGNVRVESEPNKGSTFIIELPVREILHPATEVVHDEGPLQHVHDLAGAEHQPHRKPVLMLVEDNEDFRFYLKDNLKLHYDVVEAKNGKEGLMRAQQHLPDLIVSDVMMPEMNGVEFCRAIKANQNLCHIPVILLTARMADEQKMEGFQAGADDYVTKPFSFEILQARIRNLIHQRELFHKDFRRQIEVKASSIRITSMDEKLIQNAIKIVEDNITDPDFSVEDLSHELGMSRVHLYKKLIALTGKSPLEFIRTIRLQQAAQLLEKSQLSVSEIAYKVGFNNPKYFTKYFKEEYKILPSMYASRNS
jgi:signal transduction histidine kinase/ligand-binding sensor domain-containing protein/DNA-binding response OmpR family regulator